MVWQTTGMTLASEALINVDAGEVAHMLADETGNRLTISDQNITVNSAGTISVDTANDLAATTSGTITASITTTETVDELQTLTGTGNAYTIVIADGDKTGSTATEFSAINGKTTAAIDASAVTGLASDTIDNIKTLLIAGNDTNQFTSDSFSLLTSVTVSDTTLDGSELAAAIDQANSATGNTSTVFTITAADTITGSGTDFDNLLTDETAGNIDITDQALSVSTSITVDQANSLMAATTGIVTATIVSTETLTELGTLTDPGGQNNELTITIRSEDATAGTAADLNAINAVTATAVNLTNVTALAASSLDDLGHWQQLLLLIQHNFLM